MSPVLSLLGCLLVCHCVSGYPTNKAGKAPTVDCNTVRAAAMQRTVQNKLRSSDWIPECEKDGSFKILQRNVSGTAFCATSKGVFVYQPEGVDPSTDVQCECPLRFFERLASKPRSRGVYVPYCTPEGHYKSVQCLPGNPFASKNAPVQERLAQCFCADEKGKKLADKPFKTDDSYCDAVRRDRKRKQ